MRYSGPRMLFYDPRIALAHVFETIARKKREKKARKEKAKAVLKRDDLRRGEK